jgi:hypothetical protein
MHRQGLVAASDGESYKHLPVMSVSTLEASQNRKQTTTRTPLPLSRTVNAKTVVTTVSWKTVKGMPGSTTKRAVFGTAPRHAGRQLQFTTGEQQVNKVLLLRRTVCAVRSYSSIK